jgi:pimeloyl-ACP methyl ester carboxylesterase
LHGLRSRSIPHSRRKDIGGAARKRRRIVTMAQAARASSPFLGRSVLLAATAALVIALVVALMPSATNSPAAWKTLPIPPVLPMADQSGLAPVNDIQMWYAVFNRGGGNSVLLIHGGLENADTWGNQVPLLAMTREVIIADSRGHGRSTRSDEPFGYELMADDYISLLDHLMIDKVALVGWSDVGIIGLDIAMRHPERLTKLWAYGANFNIGGLVPGFDKDPVFSRAIANAGENYSRLSPTPNEYGAFVEAISAMWNSQPDYTREQLGQITTPTMIVDGEHDEAIKREHTEELAQMIPGARFLLMPGVSHFGHLQNPDLYNSYLKAFLDSQPQ